MKDDEFYEDDEPLPHLLAEYERAAKGITKRLYLVSYMVRNATGKLVAVGMKDVYMTSNPDSLEAIASLVDDLTVKLTERGSVLPGEVVNVLGWSFMREVDDDV